MMVKNVKFPLEMKNGILVRDLSELRENIDACKLIEYFLSGRLHLWLKDRYYDSEYSEISTLEKSDPELVAKLFGVLGIEPTQVVEVKDRKSTRLNSSH